MVKKPVSKLHRQQVTGPSDWFAAFKKQSKIAGVGLSEWLTDAGRKALPSSARKTLSERNRQGRPRKS